MDKLDVKKKTVMQPEKELQRMENEGGTAPNRVQQVGDVRVLLVDSSEPAVAGIKAFLSQSIAPTFTIYHYDSPQEAMNFLKEKSVDIILLAFGVTEHPDAEEIFQKIRDAAEDTPVIIFTGEAEHDLALLIMKEGAADSVSREIFIARPERLRNAIECSLARRKLMTTRAAVVLGDIRKMGAAELRQSEAKGALELKESQETGATELRQAEERGATELKEAESMGAAEMRESHVKRLADARYHKQILSWMGGGYSVESTVDEKENRSAENTQKNEAAELKDVQKKNATELKESQTERAAKMKESQEGDATALKGKQLKDAAKLKGSQEKLAV